MKSLITCLILALYYCVSFAQIPEFVWAKSFGQGAISTGKKIAYDDNGFLITAGEFRGTGDFEQGGGTTTLASLGGLDIFVSKMDTSGNFVWAKPLGNKKELYLNDLTTDNAGNIYLVGSFDSIMDADPGPAVHQLTANGLNALFLIKLDPNGSFVWAHAFSGPQYTPSFPAEIAIDNNQDLIFCGTFTDSIDFDPGPGSVILKSNPLGNSMFVTKFNNTGSLLWAKGINSTRHISHDAMDLDNSGNILVTGAFNDSIDFDPGPGTHFIGSKSFNKQHSFVLKLSNSGNFIWAGNMGNLNPDIVQLEYQDIATDINGNVWLTGVFQGTIDVDPGVGVKNLVSTGYNNSFIVKLDASGNHSWSGVFNSDFNLKTNTIKTNSKGQVYISGYYSDTSDLDPGIGKRIVYSLNNKGFVVKLNQQGLHIWSSKLPYPSDFLIRSGNTLDLTGSFIGTVDFDPEPSRFDLSALTYDVFVQELKENACPDFTIQFDSVRNVNCNLAGYARVKGLNGHPPYSYKWLTSPPVNDSVISFTNAGDYFLEVSDSNCTITTTLHLQGPTTSGIDLVQNFFTWNLHKADTLFMRSKGFNKGCTPATSLLELELDPLVEYLYPGNHPPNSTVGNTLSWNIALKNIDSLQFYPTFYVKLKSTAKIGDTLLFISTISPFTGDVDTLNNRSIVRRLVVNSYDPNDKSVHPLGECPEAYVLKNKKLTYTIRFQNTGNAAARKVVISDSINPAMDLNTLNVIASSHYMHTEILEGQVLKFVFNNINLPDSSTNFEESIGYVSFEITPKSNVANGTWIGNRAEIYFDSNEAIITNRVHNTLVDAIPQCNTSITEQSYSREAIKIYPNPASSRLYLDSKGLDVIRIEIIDFTGKLAHSIAGNKNTINIGDLNSGVYLLRVVSRNQLYHTRFVKN